MGKKWRAAGAAVLIGVMGVALADSSGGGTKAEREAVIQAAQSLFDAMAAHDAAKLRQLFLPQAVLIGINGKKTPPAVNSISVEAFLKSISESKETLLERMWDPRVELGDGIAALWAPYDFKRNGQFSHCGHDAFHFVRSEGQWRISSITYTSYVDDAHCKASK